MQHAKFLFKWPFSGVTRGCVTSPKQCKCFEGNSEQSTDFNQLPLSTTTLLREEAVVFFMWAFQCCM